MMPLRPRVLASALYKEFYPFDSLFERHVIAYAPNQLDNVDALLLWGGEDISPAVYNHHAPAGWRSGPNDLSQRDRREVALVHEARRLGIPIIGVCRGAQLMCALSGGSLFQHTSNHAGRLHVMQLEGGAELEANSLHHQMMNLDEVDHRLIGWIDPKLSHVYVDQDGETDGPRVEPEIAWIPKSKALCIQGHPEFMEPTNPFVKYCLGLVEEFCLKQDKAIQ